MNTQPTYPDNLRMLAEMPTYQNVLAAIKSLPYEITRADGQYIAAESIHLWDKENNKPLSANRKRLIQCNVDPDGRCYFGIREDANTRYVYNGIITDVQQILLIDKLTNSFLWEDIDQQLITNGLKEKE